MIHMEWRIVGPVVINCQGIASGQLDNGYDLPPSDNQQSTLNARWYISGLQTIMLGVRNYLPELKMHRQKATLLGLWAHYGYASEQDKKL